MQQLLLLVELLLAFGQLVDTDGKLRLLLDDKLHLAIPLFVRHDTSLGAHSAGAVYTGATAPGCQVGAGPALWLRRAGGGTRMRRTAAVVCLALAMSAGVVGARSQGALPPLD